MNAAAEHTNGQFGNAPVVASPEEAKSFPAMINKFKEQIALALPKHLNADRMTRVALTEFRKNPKLAECQPVSVFASVVMASQLGLEPGLNGQGFLVPYYDHKKGVSICQFIPGWKGLVDLTQRSGRATAWTGAVFAGDQFEYEFGTNPYIKHIPCGESDPKKLLYVWAVGRVKGAEFPQIDVWPMQKVWAHRDRFNKVGNRHYSFNHPEMYARKIPLLQVLKYLPQSIELATAMSLEHAAERGEQRLDIKDAINGAFTYVPDPEPETGDSGADTGAEASRPATQADAVKDALRARQADQKSADSKGAGSAPDDSAWSATAHKQETLAKLDDQWKAALAAYNGNPPLPVEDAFRVAREQLTEKVKNEASAKK